jgi:hypothetical protein
VSFITTHRIGPRVLHSVFHCPCFFGCCSTLPHSENSSCQNTPPVCHFLISSHSCQHANHLLYSSAMGKSRSATCVIAYLMQKHNISASEALSHLRQARSICEPNEGFMKQLNLYGDMTMPDEVEDSPAYQRWVYQREVELSRACGQAPEAEKIRFEDEHHNDKAAEFELRCRKCRYVEKALHDSQGLDIAASCSLLLPHYSASAHTDADDHLQPLNTSSRMPPLRLSMSKVRRTRPIAPPRAVPITS